MQQNLNAATRCRSSDHEFGQNKTKPVSAVEAPPTLTKAYYPIRSVVAALPYARWPPLSSAQAKIAQQVQETKKSGNIDK